MNDGADPKHIRIPKLKEDLLALLDGKAITDPLTARIIAPSRYIILEEPSGRGRQEIREYVDWAAHIDVPQDVCVTRVIERVMNKEVWNSKRTFQGESRKDLVRQQNAVASWMTQYQRARSMYIQVSQIAQENADLVVDGTKTIHEIVIDIMNSLNNKQGGLNACE